jgi:DNA-binding transcriptional ArsR family regulator
MKIKFLNKINYHTEAHAIIVSYIRDDDYYAKIKDRHKQKYNIPLEDLDVLYKEISSIYSYVTSKIQIPKEKLKFYFSANEDKAPSLADVIMSFVVYDDSKESIDKFMKFSKLQKLERYFSILNENLENLSIDFKQGEIDDKIYINGINNSNLSADSKLKYILLYYNFDEFFNEVYEIIHQIVEILKEKEEVLQSIANEYQNTMMAEYEKYGDKLLENYDIKLSEEKNLAIRPILIRSNVLVLKPINICDSIDNSNIQNAYIGIHVKALFDMIKTYFINDARIISILKAFGDKSKFDILKSLRDNQMYGVEIAKMLNLTTATVSHHMSNLYNLSLINFYADNNKINYMLNKNTIEELVKALENMFLK